MKFELNLMSKVSLDEAMLLLRSSCFDRGGVAVGEMRPLSETWPKVFINIGVILSLHTYCPIGSRPKPAFKLKSIEMYQIFALTPASCTDACLVLVTLLRTMLTPQELCDVGCFVPLARLSEPTNLFLSLSSK